MKANCYFYSFSTSPYINICCFEVKKDGKKVYVYVSIRRENGEVCDGVEIRDMGATISTDYISVGYRFDNVKPLLVVETKSQFNLYRSITA
jgi:hypothetical protein